MSQSATTRRNKYVAAYFGRENGTYLRSQILL